MLVYVLGMDGDPLDPTHPAKARILLKNKKAKVVRRLPFTWSRSLTPLASPSAHRLAPYGVQG